MARGRKKNSELISDDIMEGGIGPVDAFVGGRICARRRLLQMSQKQMAERLGVTFQQVQKYEKGVNRIGAGRLYAIAKILGVDISYFFDEVEYDALCNVVNQYGEDDTKNICKIGFFQEGEWEIKFDPLRGAEATILLKLFYSLPPKSRKGLMIMLNGLRTAKIDFEDED